MIPGKLQEILALFQGVTESERREILMGLAGSAKNWEPRREDFCINEVRKDAECSDAAGIHLKRVGFGLTVRISLGPEAQTLTRAMAASFCRGLDGCTAQEIIQVPDEVVTELAGVELVRQRSRTAHYLLRRMKEAAAKLAPQD